MYIYIKIKFKSAGENLIVNQLLHNNINVTSLQTIMCQLCTSLFRALNKYVCTWSCEFYYRGRLIKTRGIVRKEHAEKWKDIL